MCDQRMAAGRAHLASWNMSISANSSRYSQYSACKHTRYKVFRYHIQEGEGAGGAKATHHRMRVCRLPPSKQQPPVLHLRIHEIRHRGVDMGRKLLPGIKETQGVADDRKQPTTHGSRG